MPSAGTSQRAGLFILLGQQECYKLLAMLAFPLEMLEQYAATLLSFLRGPRRFLSKQEMNPNLSLPPYPFLSVTGGVIFTIYVAAEAIFSAGLKRAGVETFNDPKASAIRLIALLFCFLFTMTALSAFFSRLWPVQGRPSINSIFKLGCYYAGIFIFFGVIDLIVTPILFELAAEKTIPTFVAFIPFAVGVLCGLVSFYVYWLPGLAYINRVTNSKMFVAINLWSFVFALALSWESFWVAFWLAFWSKLLKLPF